MNLNAINKYHGAKKPWSLTFSYGRALQHSTIVRVQCADTILTGAHLLTALTQATWKGEAGNVAAAQAVFFARAKACSEAASGKYVSAGGDAHASESLHVKNYVY